MKHALAGNFCAHRYVAFLLLTRLCHAFSTRIEARNGRAVFSPGFTTPHDDRATARQTYLAQEVGVGAWRNQ